MVDKNSFGDNFVRFFGNIRIKLVNFWKRVWGEDIPDFDYSTASEDEFERADELKKHIRKKDLLKAKRIFISALLTLIVLGSFNRIVNTTSFLSFFTPFCIYESGKMPYPVMGHSDWEKLPNGDIFIANAEYSRPENYNYILYILKNYVFKTYEGYYGVYGKTTPNNCEIYDVKRNKFIKVPLNPSEYELPFDGIILSKNNNIVFYKSYRNINFELYFDEYNLKTKKYTMRKVDIDFPFTVLAKYNHNLLAVNCDLSDKNLYVIDTETYKYRKLSELSLSKEYYPVFKSRPIILKDGKVILPFGKTSCNKDVAHIEIYNPQNNKCVEVDSDLLHNNLFYIEKDNGEVIFVNRENCYIFNKNDLTCKKTDKYQGLQNEIFAARLKIFGKNELLNYIDFRQFVKLNDKSLLVTSPGISVWDNANKAFYLYYNEKDDKFTVIDRQIKFASTSFSIGERVLLKDNVLMAVGGYTITYARLNGSEITYPKAEILKVNEKKLKK